VADILFSPLKFLQSASTLLRYPVYQHRAWSAH